MRRSLIAEQDRLMLRRRHEFRMAADVVTYRRGQGRLLSAVDLPAPEAGEA